MKKDDWIAVGGAVLCLLLAWLDREWRIFWLVAGGFLIVWSILAAILARRGE